MWEVGLEERIVKSTRSGGCRQQRDGCGTSLMLRWGIEIFATYKYGMPLNDIWTIILWQCRHVELLYLLHILTKARCDCIFEELKSWKRVTMKLAYNSTC
jgi:hypothetical protein